jgi:hypothetical protein
MPVVHVRALPQPKGIHPQVVIQRLCRELATVYGCEPRSFWGTWQTIEAGNYVEGDIPAKVQPIDSHPPIVNLVCSEGKSPELIENLLTRCADVLSEELGIAGNVFITYTEARSGQLYMGGAVRKKK